jgi:hypothetical protein
MTRPLKPIPVLKPVTRRVRLPKDAPPPNGLTTLNVRGIDPVSVARIKAAARARGLTIGRYLCQLELLHAEARVLADDPARPDARVGTILTLLGLQTVTR